MNYLAHAYLSFESSEILVGNMISDFVKGKKKFDYLPGIQNGIMLHRMIDTFTDAHPATKSAITVFKPVVGAYAGAFVDVVYDHFLANDNNEFEGGRLAHFAAVTYNELSEYEAVLPERFQKMLPYMIKQNWLLNYRTDSGIESSFGGVFRRAKYLEYTPGVFLRFKESYQFLKECYNRFFPDVKAMALAELNAFMKLYKL
ncbi:acyl carrier protein phosphodiesterase [soil metagenome]